jgi:limonene-1,2-epoxide hydrolase
MLARMNVAEDFIAAFARRDVDALVGCFTADGSYRDLFLGSHSGATELRAMFVRMFAGEPRHRWDFDHVLCGPGRVVAEWNFSLVRAARGGDPERRLNFGGMSVFETGDAGRCRAYREYFDRGAALAALGASPAALARLAARLPTVTHA